MKKGTKQYRKCCPRSLGGEGQGEEGHTYTRASLCLQYFWGNRKEVGGDGCLLQKGSSWLVRGWKGNSFLTICVFVFEFLCVFVFEFFFFFFKKASSPNLKVSFSSKCPLQNAGKSSCLQHLTWIISALATEVLRRARLQSSFSASAPLTSWAGSFFVVGPSCALLD